MAKKKRAKKKKRRIGPKRTLPKVARMYVKRALAATRLAKVKVEAITPNARAAWRELHAVESRLSRLA